jgi:DHA2 family multidrug resistance protein
MLAHGSSAWEAPRRAMGLLDLVVQRQAGLLSYLDAFRFVGFLSLVCAPLILFVGRTRPLSKTALAATADSH